MHKGGSGSDTATPPGWKPKSNTGSGPGPGPARHHAANRAIRENLEKNGSDAMNTRDTFHCFYFLTFDQAAECRDTLSARGARVGVFGERNPDETGGYPWYLEVVVAAAPHESVMDPITGEFDSLASELGGDYDGWYTAVD